MSFLTPKTYNVLGIFDHNDNERVFKIRIACEDIEKYQIGLKREVEKWILKHYGKCFTIKDLDYDCEGEFESPDNEEIIYMKQKKVKV